MMIILLVLLCLFLSLLVVLLLIIIVIIRIVLMIISLWTCQQPQRRGIETGTQRCSVPALQKLA